MRLVPCDLPDKRNEPLYSKWRDTLSEFYEMGVPCALVEGVTADARNVSQLRSCARKTYGREVVVKTRDGKVYLARRGE